MRQAHFAPATAYMDDYVRDNYEPVPESGCWLWKGKYNSSGYGVIRKRPLPEAMAHRVFYEFHNGPIPDGQLVLHKCDVRPCINPAHLIYGTQANNMADMVAKGRSLRGKRDWAGRMTLALVSEIRGSSETARQLSERLGLPRITIYNIRKNRSWKTA